MNNEPWLDDFLHSFAAKEPEKEFIQKVKRNIHNELQAVPAPSFVLPKNFWLYVLLIFVITLPLFSVANYFYYLVLKYIISILFPQLMTFLLIIFGVSVTLIGAICYAAIPIWTAFHFSGLKK